MTRRRFVLLVLAVGAALIAAGYLLPAHWCTTLLFADVAMLFVAYPTAERLDRERRG